MEDIKLKINYKYYESHAKDFIEGTINCDMSVQYNLFEKYLSKDSKRIMDLGFGSQEILYILNQKDIK